MRKKLAALLTVTLVVGSVAGCASSSSKAETTTAATTTAATTTVADTTTAAATTASEQTTVADTTVADTTVAEAETSAEITEAENTTAIDETGDIAVDDSTEEDYETADPDFNPVVGDDDDYWGGEEGNTDNGDFEYIGEKLREKFLSEVEASDDITSIAENIAAISGYECGTMEAIEGFLTGFSEEITGFSSGVVFMPWIGSVPFIGYVFVTDDADALVETLKANADPRWNICTEAAETVVETSGNIVFFSMCPGPDEF